MKATLLLIVALFAVAQRGPAATREITDMAGRKVHVPKEIGRIATVGSVPVLNSFILAFGEGGKIVNGMPAYASTPRYKYATLFAPGMASKPRMQAGGREPNVEELLKAAPDVAFTLDLETATILERSGIPTVFLAWREPEDVKQVINLVGDVLNKPAVAEQYARYFDATVKRVSTAASHVPREKRPRVLYCNVARLTQEQLIGEWWIETAGGLSVTNNGRKTEAYTFSLEQMFAWDPDILIVATPDDYVQVYQDARFGKLKAVAAHKVYVAPIAAHLWTNRTIEQPLTLLWAAQKFLPAETGDVDMVKEMQSFYSMFFHYQMTAPEAHEILSGKL